jgi:hypothetical protein
MIADYKAQKWELFGESLGNALEKLLVGYSLNKTETPIAFQIALGMLEGFGS